ncbi:P-loop NTPase fold protein [Microbulbifer sp. HZ11]|uniref:KAP family P-loop NTPase fold protein n=1 Tax=Microbulbifer sp. HZ11 TaxID=1453501 RepID=UPI0005BC8D68|nr:P-loop NTPase fold protein [Microbulbifer sp. HZ11]
MSSLSGDRPSSDPEEDLFGHAPFASSLANSIHNYASKEGLVLALYGPWGSGKSTVLCYVRHYLGQRPAEQQAVIVTFNPWWFSGQENLARAFLGQLQAVLPSKSDKFKKLGGLLGDFAESIGGLIDLSGVTGGAGGKVGKLIGRLGKSKPKDVPAIKSKISKILDDAGKRILVVVDDIDRLAPEETRQLFTVIKALGDFPNVIYLLAFDREVASRAIEQQSGLPGERYLEKIVQVPFEIPPVDRVALRAALFKRLDEILIETPDGLFDKSYWVNTFNDGIDTLIQVPRDIVRFSNTLAVTYPAVQGEVNPVDFIALEALRVFIPNLYDTIRANSEKFAGHTPNGRSQADRQVEENFYNGWSGDLPGKWRDGVEALMGRLFPRLGSMEYGAEWLGEWRKDLRVCHPDLFPIYFRLSLPSGAVSRSRMVEFIESIGDPDVFKAHLIQAKADRRPDGISMAREILERLMDYVQEDIPLDRVPSFIEALLDVGDLLIDPADERGMFDLGNVSRVSRPVYHLLKRLDAEQRFGVMEAAIGNGRAVACQRYLIRALDEEASKAADSSVVSLLEAAEVELLKSIWIERIRGNSKESELLDQKELPGILAAWRLWGGEEEVRECCTRAIEADQGLFELLNKFLQHTTSQTVGDWAVRRQPRLNPAWLEQYIDTEACARRLYAIRENQPFPEWASEAATQFLTEYEMINSGIDPEGIYAFDE